MAIGRAGCRVRRGGVEGGGNARRRARGRERK